MEESYKELPIGAMILVAILLYKVGIYIILLLGMELQYLHPPSKSSNSIVERGILKN